MLFDFQQTDFNSTIAQNEFEQQVLDFIKRWDSREKFVNIKTSGSTGTPKIIQVEKQKMLNSATMTCDFLGLKAGDSALLCLPVDYISGKMMLVRAIERKLKLLVETTSLKPLENLTQPIDFCAMTPLQVENSLDKIHLIKNLIIGGAKVSEDLKNKIQQKLRSENEDAKVFETYGMSETLSHIALRQLAPLEQNSFQVFEGVTISTDDRNCLQISAPHLNSELIQTNDIVELTNDQKFIFLGRADFIINSGGLKISPEVLEVLAKSKIERELIFTSVEDSLLGEKLILVIEGLRDVVVTQSLSEIDYPTKNHRPKQILFVEEFPRSENGKILRLKIKETANQILNNG